MSRRREARERSPRVGRARMRCASCGARRIADVADTADAVPACDACGGPMFVVGMKSTERTPPIGQRPKRTPRA